MAAFAMAGPRIFVNGREEQAAVLGQAIRAVFAKDGHPDAAARPDRLLDAARAEALGESPAISRPAGRFDESRSVKSRYFSRGG
jgi:hypothetical protein